jgi:DNA modification methylase
MAGRPSAVVDTRVIYCGDNLDQLRLLPDGCVDLIYIDPPFNSNRNYEVFWGETREKRSFEDRHASTAAYIDYMRPRCVELARVLKKTGSFYYHCDWHASHYVKYMLDQIFGENSFQNEIIWKRTSAHTTYNRYGIVHDTLFFYAKGDKWTWNTQYQPFDQTYLDAFYTHYDADGRRWRRSDLTGDGIRRGDSGKPWRGVDVTAKGRHWAVPGDLPCLVGLEDAPAQDKLDALDKAGLIHWPEKEDGVPMFKRYADQQPGVPLQSVWDDIPPLHNLAAERLGYPTQKPLALLERIIKTSSNPNDIVLDAFAGCATTMVAAENLGRQWIGIDISPTACRVMAKRLRDVCHIRQDEDLWKKGRGFIMRGLPRSIQQLMNLPPFEFENWAVIALGGVTNKAQVGDHGIDGRVYPVSALPGKTAPDELDFMDNWYPIQVKQSKVGRPDIDSFEAVMLRENRTRGFVVGLDYSAEAMDETNAFLRRTGKIIHLLTAKQILDGDVSRVMV